MLDRIIRAANAIREQRYADAAIVFAAGSFVRGEGTAYSDLDLVVIYETLPSAYRESFRFGDFPVEAFVHDPETLNYFFLDVDRPSGIPALAQMVLEGIEVPRQNTLAYSFKELAASVIAMGPPALSMEDRRRLRYGITDVVDDLRDPRSQDELIATGSQLYETVANYYLWTKGLWVARGKSIPRVLRRTNPEFCATFCHSFEDLFQRGDPQAIIALAEEVLGPDGGFLFEGYRLDAPPEWRKPLTEGS